MDTVTLYHLPIQCTESFSQTLILCRLIRAMLEVWAGLGGQDTEVPSVLLGCLPLLCSKHQRKSGKHSRYCHAWPPEAKHQNLALHTCLFSSWNKITHECVISLHVIHDLVANILGFLTSISLNLDIWYAVEQLNGGVELNLASVLRNHY